MTSHAPRLYALALAIVVFFLVWATVAAHPWVNDTEASSAAGAPAPTADLASLKARERALKKQIVQARALLAIEPAGTAPVNAPPVVSPPAAQVVSAPPVTVTRSS